jgi:hypothetical protein
MQRALILIGAAIVIIGLAWPWISKLPLGRLPGDIIINQPNFKVFVPITTMVLISLVLTLILWIFRR